MVDTHAHLALCHGATREVVSAARKANVTRILTVGLDEASNRDALAAAREHDEVFACVGRHPNSATGFDDRAAAEIEKLTSEIRVVAVGETGLDYYREGASRADQRSAFEAQIAVARSSSLPLVIHARNGQEGEDAVADVFSVLRASADGVTVILHCYSAGPERVAEAAERGWYCSFAGNVTYPKADELREAARRVPDELLLAETDSPFLAPQPVRGKPNHPAHVVEVGRVLAEERGLPYEELESLVEANAARAFGW